MQVEVPESQVPVCPVVIAGQSALVQQPVDGMHRVAPGHRLVPEPQVKSQEVPLHVAIAPVGGWQGLQEVPQLLMELFATQTPAQTC